jgi:hypothetical protein
MMAVHHASGGDARQEWIDLSTSDPLYAHDDDRIGRRWDSLHTDKADGITYRTLNKILRDHGAVNAQVPNDVPDDEFGKFQAEDLKRLEEAEAAMPIAKLAHVNADNIDSLFKVVNLNGKMRVLWWARSALDRNVRTPQFWSTQEFKIALQNKTVTVKTKKTDKNGAEKEAEEVLPLAQWWLTLRSRFTWDGVVLQTELESSADSVNLWRGFGVAENTKGSWKLLRQHVREVIANGDEASDAYIIKWIAWALQHPCDPAEVALILKSSTHGTGKGHSAASAPEALRRSRDASIQDGTLDRPLQRAHLAMTCLLFVDEMTIGDNKETATLNSTLTEDSIAIEPKGVDAYMMPNHVKICGASNQEHVVWVADTDRRFAAFDVSDKRRGDTAYFNAIVEELEAGGYGAMLHDLLGLDLGTWHPRDNIPHTREKISEKVKSAPPELQWLAGYLDSGVLNCQVPNRGGMVIYADPFYEHARRTVAPLRSWTDNAFAAFLKDWGVTRKRSGTSQWVFPLLVEMRAAWRKRRPWWPEFDQTVTEWGDADAEDADDMDFG